MKFFAQRIIFVFLLMALALIFVGCSNEVPKPSITEGEFDFSITYEVNGESKTISGVYACKFKRAEAALDGWWRHWDGYVKDSDMGEEIEILTNDDGVIYLVPGLDPMYFMSDPFFEADAAAVKPSFKIVYHSEKAAEKGYFSFDEDVLAQYGVRIISYYFDAPIENTYN